MSTRVVEGEPRTTVLDVAAEWKADLIGSDRTDEKDWSDLSSGALRRR